MHAEESSQFCPPIGYQYFLDWYFTDSTVESRNWVCVLQSHSLTVMP